MKILIILLLICVNCFAWSIPEIPKTNFRNFSYHGVFPPKVIEKKDNATVYTEQKFKLFGIIVLKNVYYALINSQSYKVGDIIDGYLVSHIDFSSVVLVKKNRKVVLYVDEN